VRRISRISRIYRGIGYKGNAGKIRMDYGQRERNIAGQFNVDRMMKGLNRYKKGQGIN